MSIIHTDIDAISVYSQQNKRQCNKEYEVMVFSRTLAEAEKHCASSALRAMIRTKGRFGNAAMEAKRAEPKQLIGTHARCGARRFRRRAGRHNKEVKWGMHCIGKASLGENYAFHSSLARLSGPPNTSETDKFGKQLCRKDLCCFEFNVKETRQIILLLQTHFQIFV